LSIAVSEKIASRLQIAHRAADDVVGLYRIWNEETGASTITPFGIPRLGFSSLVASWSVFNFLISTVSRRISSPSIFDMVHIVFVIQPILLLISNSHNISLELSGSYHQSA
jgi:hypothetical protein